MAASTLTEEVVDIVADHLEETAAATRMITPKAVGFCFGGIAVGIAVGFYIGYRYNRQKIYEEAFAQSVEELQQIRDYYDSKVTAVKNVEGKKTVEEIVEQRGYSVKTDEVDEVPRVDHRDDDTELEMELSQRPLPPPVPIDPTKKVFRTEDASKDKNDGWEYPYELSQRTMNAPYIIHQDEFALGEAGFSQVSFTYYEKDGVLADEDDSEIDEVDSAVGLGNLQKFGHGSDDLNILYVRNPVLEQDVEISRSSGSYEEEVKGLEHSDEPSFERIPRRRRSRSDEDDTG